jgi:O-antigen/teichoic acid export membrane protein
MGFKKDFVKNTAKFGGYTYLIQLIDFSSTIVLSRIISPEEYGFVALITVFSGFIFVFTNVGIKHAIIRNDYESETIGRLFSLTLWIGLFLFFIFSLLAYPIALFYENMEMIIPTIFMGLGFIVQAINFVPNAIATKSLDFNIIGTARTAQSIFQFLLMTLLAVLGFSYWSLIIPLTLSPFIQFLYFAIKIKFDRKIRSVHDGWLMLSEIRSLVGSITTSAVINYWSRNADNLIIGKFFGEASLGLYNRAYRFIYLSMRLITGIFGTVLFPSLKKLKDEEGDINKEFLAILGGISILNFFVSFALILFAKPIVLILWGEDWIGVIKFLPYIGVLILLQTIFAAASDYYVLQHKEKTFLRLSIYTSIFMLLGIFAGAFFSALHVIIFYTIANLILVPIQVYIGFYKSLRFKVSELTSFWGPKFVLATAVTFFIYYDFYWLQVAAAILYFFHLMYYQRHDLDKVLTVIRIRKIK